MRINPIGKTCLFNSRKIKPTQINGVLSQHVQHVYHEFHYKRYTMYYNTVDLSCIHTNRYIMYYNTTDISCITIQQTCHLFHCHQYVCFTIHHAYHIKYFITEDIIEMCFITVQNGL